MYGESWRKQFPAKMPIRPDTSLGSESSFLPKWLVVNELKVSLVMIWLALVWFYRGQTRRTRSNTMVLLSLDDLD